MSPAADDGMFGKTADELAALDLAHVWHPFTPHRDYVPRTIVRGDGVRLQDADGNWFFDGTSSIWLNVHGHRVSAIDEAIRAQLDRVAHSTLLGMGNAAATVFAERLVDVAPEGLSRVFYTDNGAGAVEAAIKMAIQFWANQGEQRPFILGFTDNYHGDTLGAVGVAWDDTFHRPFLGLLPGHPRVRFPHPYRSGSPETCLADSLAEAEAVLGSRHDIAAVIVEPVEGAAGIIVPPPGFLAGLRDLCDRHDVLLIVDEVATGFGRTGTMWACDADGISPDILCTGKGISGGYLPLAATLTTDRVYEAFLGDVAEHKTFFHGHSYTGNALGCAAAIASLDLLEALLPELPAKVWQIHEALAPIEHEPAVGEVRQAGFMVGIEFVRDRATKQGFPAAMRAPWLVADAARARGLLVRPIGNVLVFMPPLGSTPDEMDQMTGILRHAFVDAREALEGLRTESSSAT